MSINNYFGRNRSVEEIEESDFKVGDKKAKVRNRIDEIKERNRLKKQGIDPDSGLYIDYLD